MKNKLLLLFSISFCFISNKQLKAQTIVSGTIKDADGKPLQSANVMLLQSADSSLVMGTVSNPSGKYLFENIKNGQYLFMVTFTGMNQLYTKSFKLIGDKKEIDQADIYMQKADRQLSDVTMVAKKPLFEQKIDRMIINVKNSITNAGGTALDVLEKSPGVTVNRQGNTIAVNGKTGVVVMINGKINYMQIDALVQMLAAISSDNIERIELITTPPSKYDAAGNAGYINIVLINNPSAGLNGSYFLTAGYGRKGLGAGGFNFNYRIAKINLYGDYSFVHSHYGQPGTAFTQFSRYGNLIANTSFSNRDATRDVHNLRVGLDYQIDTSNVVGVLISGYISHWAMKADNGASITKNNEPDTSVKTFNTEINHWQNITTNLNFQHTFKPGKLLALDANYIYYKNANPNTYLNTYYDNTEELIYQENLKSGKVTPINFKVFSADYTTPVGKKITAESGAKISLSEFTNEVGLDNLTGGVLISDTNLSAKYFLRENISAAYTAFAANPNNTLSIKAGLRYEYTSSNLRTDKITSIVNRNYGQLFPTLYISNKLNEKSGINLSYSRRITRPSFTDLAPFTIFFDPKTFFNGNPALQPAIANTLRLGYNFKNYIFSLSYTQERNTIESFYFQTQKIDTLKNILYLSASNFKSEKFVNTSFSLPLTVNKWWSGQNNVSYNWRRIITTNNNAPVNFQISDYNVNSTQRFKLPKDFSLELIGFYKSSSYIGTTKFQPLYQLNIGLQKKIVSGDILRITGNDLFNSGSNYRFVDEVSIPGAIVKRNFNFGLVAYRLSYTHSFGNTQLKAKRERVLSAQEELNRVH